MARRFVTSLVVTLAIEGFGPGAGAAVADPRALLLAMARAAEGVRDYTMTLVSQEWDGDAMAPAETLATKWARPSKIYYKRLSPPHLGREILFADGWNGGKLKVGVHAWPVDLGINLNPHGDLAMAEAKHPVDESSLIYLVGTVLEDFRRADARGEAMAEYAGAETILGRDCHRIRVLTAQSVSTYTLARGETLWDVEKKFAGAMAPLLHENRAYGWTAPGDARAGQTIRVPRYYAARIDLWIDEALLLPLRAEIYDDRGALFERFEHRELRVNVGLGPGDFSPKNPAYRF